MFNKTVEHRTWMDVEKFAKSHRSDWTYLILGRSGPTGKTYLWTQLRQSGFNAIELSEDVGPLINYNDEDNHYLIYNSSKHVVIILNKPLPKYIYPGLKEDRTMTLHDFKYTYFEDWNIAGVTTYGRERGYLKLRNKNSFVKLFFKFNGGKYWTDSCVTVESVEGCDEED